MGIATAPQISGKTTAETVNRVMEFEEKLDSTETLSGSPTVTITPSGAGHMTCSASSASGTKVTMRFTGGTAGTMYSVKVACSTSGSQVVEGLGYMEVAAA